jgi:plastocyanin
MQLTVKNIAFDQSYIAVTAGAEITINFDNTDAMPHNFASYTDFGVTVLVFLVPE